LGRDRLLILRPKVPLYRNTAFSNRLSWLHGLHQSYDYDGPRDRFLMIRERGGREIPAELILVQNVMDEVRARVGNWEAGGRWPMGEAMRA
jgi:hypothetical protein